MFQNLKSISKLTKQELHIIGIDIKKAFDSVPIRLIKDALKYFGLEEKAIELIVCLIDNTEVRTRINNTYSEPFTQTSGVKQGDSLSPLIFVLALDFILQQLFDLEGFDYKMKYDSIGFTINNSAYMDDTDFIANTQERLIALWNRFNNILAKYGMELNEKKTEYFTNSDKKHILIGETKIETKPWIRKLGDFEDQVGKQRTTQAIERVKAKLISKLGSSQ